MIGPDGEVQAAAVDLGIEDGLPCAAGVLRPEHAGSGRGVDAVRIKGTHVEVVDPMKIVGVGGREAREKIVEIFTETVSISGRCRISR